MVRAVDGYSVRVKLDGSRVVLSGESLVGFGFDGSGLGKSVRSRKS